MYSHLSSTLMSTEWMLSSTPIEVEVEVSAATTDGARLFQWGIVLGKKEYFRVSLLKIVSEYDQEIPQS